MDYINFNLEEQDKIMNSIKRIHKIIKADNSLKNDREQYLRMLDYYNDYKNNRKKIISNIQRIDKIVREAYPNIKDSEFTSVVFRIIDKYLARGCISKKKKKNKSK